MIHKIKQTHFRRLWLPAGFAAVFAALGTYLIFASHAATPLQPSAGWTGTNGELVNVKSNLCLSTPGTAQPASGTKLIIETCTGKNSQKWSLTWGSGTVKTTIVKNAYGQCLDDKADSAASGNPVQVWQCLGDKAQNWTTGYGDGTIRINGLCLAVNGNATTSGSAVVIMTCNVPAPSVNFTSPGNGAAVNGTAVTIAANASVSPGNIATIKLSVGSTVLKTCTNATSCSVSWNSQSVSNATYTLTGVATTAAGASTTATESIVVNNVATPPASADGVGSTDSSTDSPDNSSNSSSCDTDPTTCSTDNGSSVTLCDPSSDPSCSGGDATLCNASDPTCSNSTTKNCAGNGSSSDTTNSSNTGTCSTPTGIAGNGAYSGSGGSSGSSANDTSGSSGTSSKNSLLVPLVTGGFLFLLLLAGLIFFIRRRRRAAEVSSPTSLFEDYPGLLTEGQGQMAEIAPTTPTEPVAPVPQAMVTQPTEPFAPAPEPVQPAPLPATPQQPVAPSLPLNGYPSQNPDGSEATSPDWWQPTELPNPDQTLPQPMKPTPPSTLPPTDVPQDMFAEGRDRLAKEEVEWRIPHNPPGQ